MNSQAMLPGPDSAFEPMNEASAGKSADNPLLLVHRCLRGNYIKAAVIAACISVPAAIAGYFAIPPTYTSTGLVRVAPTRPVLLYTTTDAQVPPMFESFVQAQVSFLQSRRVFDRAVENSELRKVGWPAGAAGVSRLAGSIRAVARNRSEMITVTVRDADPLAAQRALNAVLDAYVEIYGDQAGLTVELRQQRLEERERDLLRQNEAQQGRIQNLAEVHGTDNLDGKIQSLEEMRNRLETDQRAIEIQLALKSGGVAPTSSPDQASAAADATRLAEATPDQLAISDPELADLIRRREQAKAERDAMLLRLSPGHRTMQAMERAIIAMESEVSRRAEVVRANIAAGASGAPNSAVMSADQLRAQRAAVNSEIERIRTDMLQLVRARNQLSTFREAQEEIKRNLETTRRTLEALRVESPNLSAGRVTIEQRGDVPVGPSADRRLPLALAGAAAGPAVGVGAFVLLGLIRRQLRYIEDIEASHGVSAPLLGTLPYLRPGDAESDELAAVSVHHLRNVLELQCGIGDGSSAAITVTSSSPGDGKTSLSVALAMSFAVAGHKTVVVDADLVGRGLSRQMGLSDAPGLSDALGLEQINGEVHDTRIANLSCLPAGTDVSFAPERLSRGDVKRIISSLRDRFDVVLIDTGPILGSLEAGLVAGLSDRTVLTVSRGQSSTIVRASLDRLVRLGAVCAGMVFNRAEMQDMQRTISQASVGARSLRSVRALPAEGAASVALVRGVGGGRGKAGKAGGADQTP